MRILFSVLIMLLVSSLPLSAEEDYFSLKDEQPAAYIAPETQAHGCYYHRGRRYCARYCYWEVNGRRYCQKRLRQAHSQAYYYIDEEAIAPEVVYRPR